MRRREGKWEEIREQHPLLFLHFPLTFFFSCIFSVRETTTKKKRNKIESRSFAPELINVSEVSFFFPSFPLSMLPISICILTSICCSLSANGSQDIFIHIKDGTFTLHCCTPKDGEWSWFMSPPPPVSPSRGSPLPTTFSIFSSFYLTATRH